MQIYGEKERSFPNIDEYSNIQSSFYFWKTGLALF